MNLWANRLGQLTLLSVALFFLSCEDESSFLGFKNPNDKFDLYSVEIPLESSVIWLDSVRTSNSYLPTDLNRFLVGRYTDPVLGTVESIAAGQFFRTASTKLAENAVFESAELWLAFDLYFYGSETPATQTYTVHMVESDMSATPRSKYVSKTPVQLSEPVGSITTEINPEIIREHYVPPAGSNVDPTPDTMKIPLSAAFHEPLWQKVVDWSYSNDSSYFKLTEFLDAFRGLAIKGGEENTMIVGLNPFSFTQIVLNYTVGTTKGRVVFRFDPGLVSYNNIITDYTGTPLDGIAYNTDFDPGEKRYLQTGSTVGTKILMDNFFAFTDTVGSNIIINEVQLVVEDVETHADGQAPPVGFHLRGLNADNTIRRLPEFDKLNTGDNDLYGAYRGLISVDYQHPRGLSSGLYSNNFGTLAAFDDGSPAYFEYNESKRKYVGYATLFFQQVYRNRADKQWTSFLMFPTVAKKSTPASLKAVNRAVFPANGVKMIVKYTKPTVVE